MAILFEVVLVALPDRGNALEIARSRFSGQTGSALVKIIREHAAVDLLNQESETLQELLSSAWDALEARHRWIHASWFLFDLAVPEDASIAGLRPLPPRKRNQGSEVEEFIEGSIEKSMGDARVLEDVATKFRKWARAYNDAHSIYPRRGFARQA